MSYKIIIDSCGELLDEWKKDEHFESCSEEGGCFSGVPEISMPLSGTIYEGV